MKKKKVLDISETKKEFELLEKEIYILKQRFIALALDYKSYINSSIRDSDIFEYRDNVLFRLNSAKFHLNLLFNHLDFSRANIEANVIANNPAAMFSGMFEQEVTCLLDSFIYHLTSVFDYISSLTNYIVHFNNKKALMWTQLARSVRGKNNKYKETKFASKFDTIDREFVSKLYDHRSLLIHRESDIGGHTVSHDLMSDKVITIFFAGNNLIKTFKPLKELNKENDLTIKYVAIWIFKEIIDKVTELLFALKEEVESKYDGRELMMYYEHPETKEKIPASKNFWYEKEK